MDIQTRESGQVLVVKPMVDEINSANAHFLKNTIVDCIIRDHVRLAIDLSDVDLIDSSGLSALLSTLKTVSHKGKMVLFGLSKNVAKLFSITNLDKGIFEIHTNESDAVKALQVSEP